MECNACKILCMSNAALNITSAVKKVWYIIVKCKDVMVGSKLINGTMCAHVYDETKHEWYTIDLLKETSKTPFTKVVRNRALFFYYVLFKIYHGDKKSGKTVLGWGFYVL